MTLKNKILIVLGSIIVIGLLGFIVYQQLQLSKQQDVIEKNVVAQKQLADKIIRSQSEYATRDDVEKFIKNNNVSLKEIQKDLGKLNADVNAVNKVVVNSIGRKEENLPSTSTEIVDVNVKPPICPDGSTCPDPYGYLTHRQNFELSEPFADGTNVPFGSVGFSSWQAKPWNVNILPREYNVVTVVGTDENQRNYIYNKFNIKVGDKYYDVKISSAQTLQVYPEEKWSFWNPRLFAGMDAGLTLNNMNGEFIPSINLGIISYGRYRNLPDWSFLQLGLGYGVNSKNIEFVLSPFMYNVGRNIPLINNTYVGPSLSLSPTGNFSTLVGIRVGL